MNKITISLVLCFFSVHLFAQRQASNWYFGYGAGIQFDLANNTINSVDNGFLFTNEGCASISDDDGNLLFYTDGKVVWDRTHGVMINGTGLYGDSSSTQSAIIVPKPNDDNIYYVFTVDTTLRETDPNFGLNYSIIDMSMNFGLGAVTQKNINLLSFCSEKLTAVLKDCITDSIWVITLASENGNTDIYDTFHAYEVSELGVNTTSIKSTFPGLALTERRGYLRLSPDGSKMAAASVTEGLQLFDFDKASGMVSNIRYLNINNFQSPFPYGIEFSPNSQLLYAHASNDFFDENIAETENPANHTSVLVQYNLLAEDVESSQVVIDDRNLYRGALQLGPNGKIYRALSATYTQGLPYLASINNPNKIGRECNYQHQAISLSPNDSSQGLPPFITSFFNKQIDIIKNGRSSTNLDLCDGDTYTLTSIEIPGATYTWTKDDTPLTENNSSLEVLESGHYEVSIDPNNGECAIEGDAFVLYNRNPIAKDHIILQCEDDDNPDGLTIFNLNEANTEINVNSASATTKFYLDNARTQEINGDSFSNTSNPQIIYVELKNEKTGCSDYSELTLKVSTTNVKDVSIILCDDDTVEDGFYTFNLLDINNQIIDGLPDSLNITYYENYEDALLENNKLEEAYTNNTPFQQTIFGRVENDNNCYGISEIELVVNTPPDIEQNAEVYYCLNQFPSTISINAGILDGNIQDYSFNWSTGATTYSIDVNEIIEYQVVVTNLNTMCSKTRTISLLASDVASFSSPPFTSNAPADNNIISLFVTGNGEYQFQLQDESGNIVAPYQSNNTFENINPGIYTASVRDTKNNCGIVNQLVYVIGFPKFFTPNNDGVNDTWEIYGISEMDMPDIKVRIFNRYGKLLKEFNPIISGWDGILNGQTLPPDDYWFSIKLQDGRIFRDHFTLKN
ncbi:T9SS type B sorting domain-containing protein [Seonamhaeicola sp. ML3]|uniref:T9SS type B sorting domain-containing protein n=1 Tax=Seonamhaeicola sp. ML3 TaxID=2937786 RepID=UPI00200E9E7E|nr:T9SS type B sorting domain-containing protein [Seonamhaeicola sp. ML3]